MTDPLTGRRFSVDAPFASGFGSAIDALGATAFSAPALPRFQRRSPNEDAAALRRDGLRVMRDLDDAAAALSRSR